MFWLRFPSDEIMKWAEAYPVEEDHLIENVIAPRVKEAGFLNKLDLLTLCRWRSQRSTILVEKNDDSFVQAVTQTALTTPNERLRIEVLLLLDGVSWPTASIILHFMHNDPYPILDARSLWSVNVDRKDFSFVFWQSFTAYCRSIAQDAKVPMRQLERALWQYAMASEIDDDDTRKLRRLAGNNS